MYKSILEAQYKMYNNFSKILYLPPKKKKHSIVPIFLPFLGCPQICIFCNQSLQTGQESLENIKISNNIKTLSNLLTNALEDIKNYPNAEIAFYGGTFTLLAEDDFQLCLDFIAKNKSNGLIKQARCSTRPDALSPKRLKEMKEKGMDTIELGIQSFSTEALMESNRNYTKEIALEGCKIVKEHGFNLGIQLMPNLPGTVYNDFINDVDIAVNYADFMRFYPCLVVDGTLLAKRYKEKRHTVWPFEKTLELLSQGLYMSWQKKINLIRIGVHYEEEFYKNILAGVTHPSLGQLVQEKALKLAINDLYKEISSEIDAKEAQYSWQIPLYFKGLLKLKQDADFYNKIHISSKNIQWHKEDFIRLDCSVES